MEENYDIERMEGDFKEKKFYFSPSSFNKLSKSPKQFYKKYVLKENDDEDKKYFIFGRLLHCLLLERDKFDDQFLVSPESLPSDNVIAIIKSLFNEDVEHDPNTILEDFSEEIIEGMKERAFYDNIKDPVKKLAKVINDKGISYFEFMQQSLTKTIVDLELYDKALIAMEEILKNESILLLIGHHDFEGVEVYNELELDSEGKGFFGLKGICDNLVIDHNIEKVFINDFKTTSKRLVDFKDSVEKFGYNNQAAIYSMILKEELDNVEGYDFEFNFVVFDVDSNIYSFRVTEESMKEWKAEVVKKLDLFRYHFDSMDFTLPVEFLKEPQTL